MIDINKVKNLSHDYNLPIEDVLFISLNFYGVNYVCDFNRMRMEFRIADNELLDYARQLNAHDFYFALPVNDKSPFSLINNQLLFDGKVLGAAIDPSEDFCDSNYPRRNGTVLNINPNSRTSCRGCKFCYTNYQVPRDRKRIMDKDDIRNFFAEWMDKNKVINLSHLIQVAVVTGCYNSDEELLEFLLILKRLLNEYKFKGEIFYLGSQITSKEALRKLAGIQPFCYCLSIECFNRRNELLRDKKSSLNLQKAYELMIFAKQCGYQVNFSYVLGLESLETIEKYFTLTKQYITRFPIINIIQIHKYHNSTELLDPSICDIEYFFRARKIIERIFLNTEMRPRVWENYRSLWFLKFGNEVLSGIRMP